MAREDYLPAGIMGYRAAVEDKQKDAAFALDLQAAEQDLYAKSLEIQDYLDAENYRKKTREAGVVKAESEIEMTPIRDAAERETLAITREQNKLKNTAFKIEEMSRALFGLNEANYVDRFKVLDSAIKNQLGLTGNWAEDAPKIRQTREFAINTAQHMRAVDIQGAKNSGSSSYKPKAIKYAKANEEMTENWLAGDSVYDTLGDDASRQYRSRLTYLAMEMYQRQIDAGTPPDKLIPPTTWLTRIKEVADKHVKGSDGMFAGFFNSGTFDAQGFDAEIASMYGIGIDQRAIDQISSGQDAQRGVDIYEGPQAKVPEAVQKGIDTASTDIASVRQQQGIPDNIPDHVVFNKMVEKGILNPDGTRAAGKAQATQPAGEGLEADVERYAVQEPNWNDISNVVTRRRSREAFREAVEDAADRYEKGVRLTVSDLKLALRADISDRLKRQIIKEIKRRG